MKIKIILAFFIFSLGMFYLTLAHYTEPVLKQSAPFELLYGITGNNETAIDLLKCLDKKSIIYAFSNHESPVSESNKLTKECLEEWLFQETDKFAQKSGQH
jgi:hypothetical protein